MVTITQAIKGHSLKHCNIFLAFGGLALKNAQVASGGARYHSLEPALRQLAGLIE